MSKEHGMIFLVVVVICGLLIGLMNIGDPAPKSPRPVLTIITGKVRQVREDDFITNYKIILDKNKEYRLVYANGIDTGLLTHAAMNDNPITFVGYEGFRHFDRWFFVVEVKYSEADKVYSE